ncbi:MAG: DUF1015 domain-containing protein [Treponema sp.]|nr:DUF1015 domain-containing protein [Treponema sp.]
MYENNILNSRLAAVGLKIPEILLPAPGIDLQKWAVIACDQFTQDRGYWEKVREITGTAPSALDFIFPEVYLLNSDEKAREAKREEIKSAMESSLKNGIFGKPGHYGVYIERSAPGRCVRKGLVMAIDLEKYDWNPKEKSLIRATEGTVPERIPPRMQIRQTAALETTHVLLLIDDDEDKLISGLGEIAKKNPPLYQTQLMLNSGAIIGWACETGACCKTDENCEARDAWETFAKGLENLAAKAQGRYGVPCGVQEETPFLYAVGDGNHSLAAAKASWEEYKKIHAGEAGLENHPRRYALVELENLYDSGINFEPIHRIVFGITPKALQKELTKSTAFDIHPDKHNTNILRLIPRTDEISTVSLEPLLDNFLKQNAGSASIDYIHGEDELIRLAGNQSRPAVGILLPPIEKNGLFKTIAVNGPLPRKSFSMGESREKRFYLECRKL